MLKFKLLIFTTSILLSFSLSTRVKSTETPYSYFNLTSNYTEENFNLTTPEFDNLTLYYFSSICLEPSVSGFFLKASCYNLSNELRNTFLNFRKCLFNYNGNLNLFNGAYNQLYTKNCRNEGMDLICSCQQPIGGWRDCSMSFDNFVVVNSNGTLSCMVTPSEME